MGTTDRPTNQHDLSYSCVVSSQKRSYENNTGGKTKFKWILFIDVIPLTSSNIRNFLHRTKHVRSRSFYHSLHFKARNSLYLILNHILETKMCGIFAYLNFLTPKSRQEILEIMLNGLQVGFVKDRLCCSMHHE